MRDLVILLIDETGLAVAIPIVPIGSPLPQCSRFTGMGLVYEGLLICFGVVWYVVYESGI